VELKHFIKETIENIVDGVVAAQANISEKGADINPRNVQFRENGQWNNHNSGMPHSIEFDVGLTTASETGSVEGVGVFLGSINLGKKNNEGVEQTAVTRIKFSIPLELPSGKDQKSE
jgi:hypothetical protein